MVPLNYGHSFPRPDRRRGCAASLSLGDSGNVWICQKKLDVHQQTKRVYQKLGTKYVQDTLRAVPQEIKSFIQLLPAHGKILDVGCAGGRDTKLFVRAHLQAVGIDVVPAFLRAAKKYVPEAAFVSMDVRKIRFPKKSFDAIWANAVLLHLQRRELLPVLKKFYGILRSHGKLHVRMKQGTGHSYSSERLVSNHRRFFTYVEQAELERLIRKAGFQILRSKLYKDKLGRSDVRWVGVWAEKK